MPRGIPSWPSIFDWFLIDFPSILRPLEPSKSLFFLRKNKVFSKTGLSKLASIFLRFWCQLAAIFPPKIHPNPIKNRSWQASIFKSIFAWMFSRFGLDFGTQLGAMVASKIALGPPQIDSQDGLGSHKPPWNSPGLDFHRFLIDVWRIFDWFLIDFWMNVDGFSTDFS